MSSKRETSAALEQAAKLFKTLPNDANARGYLFLAARAWWIGLISEMAFMKLVEGVGLGQYDPNGQQSMAVLASTRKRKKVMQ